MIRNKINKLRKLIEIYNIDGYIIPKNDEYFSEYAFPNRLEKISNFSGSAGFAIILKNNNYLFVDGRYTIQAKSESGKLFKIVEIPKVFPFNLFKKSNKKINIGFDPNVFTSLTLQKYFGNICNLTSINKNLVDQICLEKNNKKNSFFFSLDKKVTGETIGSKIKRLRKVLNKNKIDNIFISAPENVAWLLNLRGMDNPNSPIPNCRVILSKNNKIILFTDLQKIKKIKNFSYYKKINFKSDGKFFTTINNLNGKNFCIDKLTCSVFFESLIKSKFNIVNIADPCYLMKSIKNLTEINNMKKAHIYDGAALTKFIYYVKNKKNINFDELMLEKKLENYRKENKKYLYPSFNTIAASGPNAAIPHYRANKQSNRKINKKDIFLVDSGGQYKYGTTDVTRTICFDKISKRIKNIFTRVLKGHIAVVNTNVSKIKTGNLIDKKARYWLKKIYLDYGHGTGHGVGYFLNVHEGPQGITKYNNINLKEGMILSNEPGYYKENKFGIRIENLVYVSREKNKLVFKNLTFAPIDKDLIDYKILNNMEKKYLHNYHSEVYSKISKYLNNNEKKWMHNLI
tara:strand:+ start:302 stop:2014 length:1713 start_codon:yes stop_codon:yes gene_type:complete